MSWLRQLFTRRTIYNDLAEEIRQHLAEKVEYLVAGGMSRQDAEYAAKREFGNVARIENGTEIAQERRGVAQRRGDEIEARAVIGHCARLYTVRHSGSRA